MNCFFKHRNNFILYSIVSTLFWYVFSKAFTLISLNPLVPFYVISMIFSEPSTSCPSERIKRPQGSGFAHVDNLSIVDSALFVFYIYYVNIEISANQGIWRIYLLSTMFILLSVFKALSLRIFTMVYFAIIQSCNLYVQIGFRNVFCKLQVIAYYKSSSTWCVPKMHEIKCFLISRNLVLRILAQF